MMSLHTIRQVHAGPDLPNKLSHAIVLVIFTHIMLQNFWVISLAAAVNVTPNNHRNRPSPVSGMLQYSWNACLCLLHFFYYRICGNAYILTSVVTHFRYKIHLLLRPRLICLYTITNHE